MNIPALKAFESSTLVYSQLQLLFNLFQDPYALFVRAFIMDVFDDDVEQTLSCLLETKISGHWAAKQQTQLDR